MLDHFLKVAYENEKKRADNVKLAHDLKKLPNKTLKKLANGQMKLAFGESEDWLEKFKGTPLFEEALALEKAELENDVARQQALSFQPSQDQFWRTQSQIRLQKKMLDLQLVEMQAQQGQAIQAGGMLPTEPVPADTQGAGAMGDMAAGGVDAEKMSSVKIAAKKSQKASLKSDDPDTAFRNWVKANPVKSGALGGALGGAFSVDSGNRIVGALGGALGGAVAGAAIDYFRSRSDAEKMSSAKMAAVNFEKAALNLTSALNWAKANPARAAALAGAGVGAVGGAVAGGPDHRLSGALGGAALGAGVGHVAGGVGGRMIQKKMNLGDAVKDYGKGVADKARELFGRASGSSKPAAPAPAAPAPADPFKPDTFKPDTFKPKTFEPDTFKPKTLELAPAKPAADPSKFGRQKPGKLSPRQRREAAMAEQAALSGQAKVSAAFRFASAALGLRG